MRDGGHSGNERQIRRNTVALGLGFPDRYLTEEEAREIVVRAFEEVAVDGKKVLVIIPDHTRTAPIDLMFRLLYESLAERVRQLDYLMALGTHPPMSEEMINRRVGISSKERYTRYAKVRFFNHAWKDPQALSHIATLRESEVAEISEGRFRMEVPLTVNRMVHDYDLLLIVGPVFPHEVVGFSGGNKYLFPGIAGQEIIDFFHWLGALITNPIIIGNKWTPVRRVVDRAAQAIPVDRFNFSLVVKEDASHSDPHHLAGLFFGTPEEAWSEAADLSQQLHIRFHDRPYHTVLSCAPRMYDDLWTGGKCMYKLEPVVADGGTLIIFAPHIAEISATHGHILEEIGYHIRDYFLADWNRFSQYPWGVLAHSTHVRGIGRMVQGREEPRINVVLATRIPEETCRRINLGYLDPDTVNPEDYACREDEGVLHVPKAGEILHRLKNAPPHLGGAAKD